MGVKRVHVEIEELVLHGFGRSDGLAVAGAIEQALRSQLAAAGDGFGATRSIERIDAAPVELAAGASAPTIGGAVAERLNRSLQP